MVKLKLKILILVVLVALVLTSGCIKMEKLQEMENQTNLSGTKEANNSIDMGVGSEFDPIDFTKSKIIENLKNEGWYSKEWKKEEIGGGVWKVSVDNHRAVWVVYSDGFICAENDGAEYFSEVGYCGGEERGKTKRISNQSISGEFDENQIWSGNIIITGDTTIKGDLTIRPGTVIKFKVQDDQNSGEETEADGYNDHDPTRLEEYAKTHSKLNVRGKLIARGTPEKRILFTSSAEEPYYADWIGVEIGKDGSLIEYCTVEWSRNGIILSEEPHPNTIIRNNVINQSFCAGICTDSWGGQIYSNEIWECGHEGIDVHGGTPVIEGNRIHSAHTGIVVLGGSATIRNNTMTNVGKGIHFGDEEAEKNSAVENNYVELAPENSKKEWRYGNFAYKMFGDPVVYSD